jgi:hypothetical protein
LWVSIKYFFFTVLIADLLTGVVAALELESLGAKDRESKPQRLNLTIQEKRYIQFFTPE